MYDENGRLVSSTPEVEWDETEREWVRSYEHYLKTSPCECGCGYPGVISQDPMTEFKVRVDPPTRCHIRTALIEAQKAFAENSDRTPDALMWSARLVD